MLNLWDDGKLKPETSFVTIKIVVHRLLRFYINIYSSTYLSKNFVLAISLGPDVLRLSFIVFHGNKIFKNSTLGTLLIVIYGAITQIKFPSTRFFKVGHMQNDKLEDILQATFKAATAEQLNINNSAWFSISFDLGQLTWPTWNWKSKKSYRRRMFQYYARQFKYSSYLG